MQLNLVSIYWIVLLDISKLLYIIHKPRNNTSQALPGALIYSMQPLTIQNCRQRVLKMADTVWRGNFPWVFGHLNQLLLNTQFVFCTPLLRKIKLGGGKNCLENFTWFHSIRSHRCLNERPFFKIWKFSQRASKTQNCGKTFPDWEKRIFI